LDEDNKVRTPDALEHWGGKKKLRRAAGTFQGVALVIGTITFKCSMFLFIIEQFHSWHGKLSYLSHVKSI
jgi:hypothetical protein